MGRTDAAQLIARRALLHGAAAGGLAALSGCVKYVDMTPEGWGNQLGTTYALPRWHWAPRNADDIIEAVRRAEREGRRIRMTGSGYSFSDVAANDDWLLSPRRLTQVLPLDGARLVDGAHAETLVRVQSGITVRALNDVLDARGLALPNMGAFDLQTYVGAASTGTHGSGSAFGPLASQIVSIQVVAAGGELIQVEPATGVTDRARFDARLPEARSTPVRLVNCDVLFNALAVSLGCLGIVYAVVLRATTKFWLIERRTMTTWEKLAEPDGVVDRLINGGPLWPVLPDRSPLGASGCVPVPGTDPDHVEINYTPYADPDRKHTALLTQRWRTQCRPPSVGGVRGTLGGDIEHCALHVGDEVGLDLPKFIEKRSEVLAAHVTGMKGLARAYYADRSNVVFQVGLLDYLHVYGIELHFEATAEVVKAAVAENLREAERLADYGILHSSPPTLRFIDEAKALLSMQNGRPKSCSMELGVFTDAYGAEELLRAYEDVFVGGPYKARPHWGLDRNCLRGEASVRSLYGDSWCRFRDALAQLNPNGTFDGRITDRLEISSSMPRGPSCPPHDPCRSYNP